MDPRLGIVTSPLERPGPVTWIENGVLRRLGHPFGKAFAELQGDNGLHALRAGTGFRMSGGDTSMEEMIRTTRRGLLVTRLSNIRSLDRKSLLSTGLTRDGLWLIENGEITRAVRNFRFTESPIFMLNQVEALGEPVPVWRPTTTEDGQLTPAIVPPIKALDFSFTSLVDAV
jgi:predicted Zn-dependent protease